MPLSLAPLRSCNPVEDVDVPITKFPCATTDVQGRLLNGAKASCSDYVDANAMPPPQERRFLHIEQSHAIRMNDEMLGHLFVSIRSAAKIDVPVAEASEKRLLRPSLSSSMSSVSPLPQSQLSAWQDLFNNNGGIANWTCCQNYYSNPCGCDGHIVCSANNRSIIQVDLSRCGLVGQLPPSMVSLGDLEQLSLSHNFLSGPFPEIFESKNLARLALSYNQFSGPLPPQLSLLKNLTFLTLTSNQFTGSLPPQW